MSVLRPRLAALVMAASAITLAACADAATSPDATLARARQTFRIEGDTLDCRNGWTVLNGRYVCNEE